MSMPPPREKIPFNRPFLTGKETEYIRQAVESGKISGNGAFTAKCHRLLEQRYGFRKTLLTTSCTDALEMAAILADVGPGDEVILPSFTFVSTALAFVRQGATIVFADSRPDHPNLDLDRVEALITPRTKVLGVVHYAGVACDMGAAMALAEKHRLLVVEDAAQAIDATYKGRPLGGIAPFGCFSFHETKNVICGEGGALAINDERFLHRSEIIWEKGTNRAEFFRGEVNKYGWVDTGSSFLPSEITAAFLYAQLEQIESIQARRHALWNAYAEGLAEPARQGRLALPVLPAYAGHNAHMFYVVCGSPGERTALIDHLKQRDVHAVFHYLSLHKSPFYAAKHDGRDLPNADRFADGLLRLPMYHDLTVAQVDDICAHIRRFCTKAAG
jgi:dTDP-4-amino-4,6-dideoxygalactose transaminase